MNMQQPAGVTVQEVRSILTDLAADKQTAINRKRKRGPYKVVVHMSFDPGNTGKPITDSCEFASDRPISISDVLKYFEIVGRNKEFRYFDWNLYADIAQEMGQVSAGGALFPGDNLVVEGKNNSFIVVTGAGGFNFIPGARGMSGPVVKGNPELPYNYSPDTIFNERLQSLGTYHHFIPTPRELLKNGNDWKSFWNAASPWVHGALDILGFVPIVGNIADGANVLIYTAEGDYTNAAFSSAAMIPFAGLFAAGGVILYKGGKKLTEKAMEKLAKECVEEVTARLTLETGEVITRELAESIVEESSERLGRKLFEASGELMIKNADELPRYWDVFKNSTKPLQDHHWINQATLTGQKPHDFIKLAKEKGIDITKKSNEWNIDKIPHEGVHTKEYFEFVKKQLEETQKLYFESGGNWNKEQIEQALKRVVEEIKHAVKNSDIQLYVNP
ncbi:MAG: hypothetical protein GY754_12945 [bacterium]|nr:hypothetical protein [bacterium]